MASGTTFAGPANAWAAGNFIGATGTTNGVAALTDTFQITGVIVLPGIEAPSAARSPFIMRPFDQELAVCKRYWQKLGGSAAVDVFINGYQVAGQGLTQTLVYPVEMRAIPTGAIVGAWNISNGTLSINSAGTKTLGLQVLATVTGSLYAYTANTSCFITLDARL
jgi:hypothetical protein